jgi:ABC-type transport system substrate-binding protein
LGHEENRKERIVKIFRVVALTLAATVLITATAAVAATSKKVAFIGTYTGQATTKVDGNTATIAATGSGKATVLGPSTLTGAGTGDTSQQPCVPFGGKGLLKGSGSSIAFKVLADGKACGDEGGHEFSIVGHIQVTKATGKLANARGTLKFTGTYSHDDGSYSVKFTGTLVK